MTGRILVLGGGFAGLWSALAAARARATFDADLEIVLLNDTPWHSIRVRNYEADLSDTRVALDDVLGPVDIRRLQGRVTGIDVENRSVAYEADGSAQSIGYDRLVFALGSRLARPPIPGLAEHGFDVDTHDAAMRLNEHIARLGAGASTVLVVGGGLTGIETAAEMPGKLRAAGVTPPRVILADHAPRIGSDMGAEAVPVIEEALRRWASRRAAACRSSRSMPGARRWKAASVSKPRRSCGAPACAPIRSRRPFRSNATASVACRSSRP